jgi:hypothetical protein
MREDALSSFE